MAASYRFRPGARAPAKDEDGQYMCDFSPYSHTVSPLLGYPKNGKQSSQPDAIGQDHREVEESFGSMPVHGVNRAKNREGLVADAASINTVAQILQETRPKSQIPVNHDTPRKPLQEANRDISAHPVRVSHTQGSSLTAPGKLSTSQQQSTAAFKEKHLRQMRAANERLEQTKLRGASMSSSEVSNTMDARPQVSSSQRSTGKREIVQTHVNVSKLVSEHSKGQVCAKPSTEALLRAASMGQHGTGRAAVSRVPRTSSMGKGKQSNEQAKKKVYSTLQSPNLEAAVVADGDAPEDNIEAAEPAVGSAVQDAAAPPKSTAPLTSAAERFHADARETVRATDSTDSQRQSKDVPRSVAALANRFEGKATPASMKHLRSPAKPPAHAQPSSVLEPQVGATRSALPKAPTSGSAAVARIHAPTQPWRPAESTTEAQTGVPSNSAADSASAEPVPQDTRLQRKVTASIGKLRRPSVTHTAPKYDAPESDVRKLANPLARVPTPPGPKSIIGADPPPVAAQAHAAFGSPMHGGAMAADDDDENAQPARHSMLSMSCNVNMASPTAADEVISAWKKPPAGAPLYRDGRENVPKVENARPGQAAANRHRATGDKQPKQGMQPEDGGATDKLSKKSSSAQAAAASPPTRAAFARLSDACTSPVESLWRPLRKALTPHSEHDDDAMMTNLLAPDGSPAQPNQQFASNSPARSPTKARPSTAACAPARPSSAGATKARPATAGTMRVFPSQPMLNCSEAHASASDASSDQASKRLHTCPDRVHSVGSGKQRLEPAVSRGALEMSAAHLRGSLVDDEPFVDLMGVHVDSDYLKSGRSGKSGTGCCTIM
eukprot:jgi/Ulvmu1/3045/UM015_0085.1